MATTRRSDIGNLIYAGIEEIFNKSLNKPRNLQYKQISREKRLKALYGYYETMGDIGPAEEHVEEQDVNYHKIEWNNRTTITSKVYDNGVKASVEGIHFDLYDVINSYFGDPLVNTMVTKKEKVVADVWNDSFTTTGADGVYLASDSHPLKNDITKYNDNLATGSITPENVEAAKNQFHFIYDMAGVPIGSTPTHMLIHPSKMWSVLAILNSNLIALELSNTKNTLQDYMPIKVITNIFLDYASGVSPWFLIDKTLEKAGCVLQISKGLELKSQWDWDNLTFKAMVYEIYGAGMTAPGYGFIGSTGA